MDRPDLLDSPHSKVTANTPILSYVRYNFDKTFQRYTVDFVHYLLTIFYLHTYKLLMKRKRKMIFRISHILQNNK